MTLKQKLAIAEITENHRPVSTVMKEVGYSPNTYSKPSNLTKSRAWEELVERRLPDDKLLQKHEEALDATKKTVLFDGNVVKEPDQAIRLKAVELGYKLKGKLSNVNMTQINIGEMGVEFINDVKSEIA